MPRPVITIGLPVYNAAPWLAVALRSVFAQTFTAWELIAVDDGSTDGSAAWLQNLDDPRVRILGDGCHRGLAARLNQIARAARGEFIARLDADDFMHPDRLARQLEYLEGHPETDVLGCAMLVLDDSFRPIGMRRAPQQHDEICRHLTDLGGMMHATVLARARWVRAHPYDETLRNCEDQDLWFSTHAGSRFANLAEPLYFYRGSVSFSLREYARAKRELMALLWRRRRLLGWRTMSRGIARHAAAVGAYAAASVAELAPALLRRRNQPLDGPARAGFQSALDRIRATPLPLAPGMAGKLRIG